MKKLRFVLFICFLFNVASFCGTVPDQPETIKVFVEWQNDKPSGTVEVLNGQLDHLALVKVRGEARENHFEFVSSGQNRIEISLKDVNIGKGSGSTLVSIHTGNNSFSFLLRDASADYPIWIPQYHVVVCQSGDNRSYSQIEMDIKNRNLQSKV